MTERLSEDLRELLGDEDFLKLVENFGGDRLYVPQSVTETKVSNALGEEAAAKLAKRYGGDYPRIPLARAFRARHYRSALGLTNPEVADRLGMTVSGVEKLFSRHPAKRAPRPRAVDARQADLFD
ncbi:hypothetical protein DYI37_11490 [Fulvimarina endophytica]|uniref:Mor transcription activator domain-containing protein n=1 Tax=Fulvimarina endophytica TaxID=2293836 RepID=A0A371X316_9HYPH|nr:hypothetical protein [Fulvimarina endophytica]RFC63621.1 hypothetical protein DYI37_11490 [Fulvimarina endophytica]